MGRLPGAHSPVSGDAVHQVEVSPNTVTQRLGALRFFYTKVLKKNWSVAETPYPRKVFGLPEILSPEEVACLIDAAELPFYRILLMTLYGTGARRTEAAHLKVGDIDSRRMVVHIHGGKGNRDHDVMLSQKVLGALRGHWRATVAHGQSPYHNQGSLGCLSARSRQT